MGITSFRIILCALVLSLPPATGQDKLKPRIEVAVIAFCPTMRSGPALDKFGRDAYAVAAAPDTALEDIAHAKFAAYLAQINSFALVLET